MAKGYPVPDIQRIPRTAPGERCGRLRGPGEPRPGVPTHLSHRGEGWGRLSGPQSSGVTWPSVLGSYANPWGPEGRGAAPCRCHLRHQSRSSRAWWAGQGRRSVPGWGRDPPGGGGPGPPQRQRQQRVFRLGRTVLSPAAWTLGPQGSPARPGKTTQLRRKRAGDQRGAYSPAPLAPAAPPQPAARSRRGSPSSRMLRERSLGSCRRLPQPPPGGGREPARGILGDVVLRPLHIHPCSSPSTNWWWSFLPPCFLSVSLRGSPPLLANNCGNAPVEPWASSPRSRSVVLKMWWYLHQQLQHRLGTW